MSDTFRAILVSRDEDKKQSVDFVDMREDELMEGDVTVAVEATTVNYKDGLAITGMAPVVRRWPLVPGIDFAGTVSPPEHPDWKPATRSSSMAGAWARPITAPMRARPASRAIGWCGFPLPCRRATRWRSAPPATRRCCA
jgi:NADPH:quinone reductase-like Zn-dependent oxidoreductase